MLKLILGVVIVGAALLLWFYLLGVPSKSKRGNKSRSQPSLIVRIVEVFEQKRQQWRCAPLRRELLKRVSPDTAERLIASARLRNPGKPEHWYLEKVIYDLKRGR